VNLANDILWAAAVGVEERSVGGGVVAAQAKAMFSHGLHGPC
jgi:hypothetical protein